MKYWEIKKISAMLMTVIATGACNNSNTHSNENGSDSSQDNPYMQPGSVPDSIAQKGDTAMYQRMQDKTSDSTPQ